MADPRAASQCITATATTGTAPVALGTARATRSRAPDEFGARWHHHARAGRGIPGVATASRFPRSQNQAPAPNTNCRSAAARASLRASRATPASQRNAGLGTTLMTTATMGVLFAGGAGPAVQCRTASPPQRPAGKIHQRAVSESGRGVLASIIVSALHAPRESAEAVEVPCGRSLTITVLLVSDPRHHP
jgi:hypothetical protein